MAESRAKAGNETEPVNIGKDTNNPQKKKYSFTKQSEETNLFILPSYSRISKHWLHNGIVLFDDSLSLFRLLAYENIPIIWPHKQGDKE